MTHNITPHYNITATQIITNNFRHFNCFICFIQVPHVMQVLFFFTLFIYFHMTPTHTFPPNTHTNNLFSFFRWDIFSDKIHFFYFCTIHFHVIFFTQNSSFIFMWFFLYMLIFHMIHLFPHPPQIIHFHVIFFRHDLFIFKWSFLHESFIFMWFFAT